MAVYGVTFKDFLQIIAIPVAIAVGTYVIALWQGYTQEQRAQDEALQAYITQMSQLMVGSGEGSKGGGSTTKLRSSAPESDERILAGSRTTAVLRRVKDPELKRYVVRFLNDTKLIRMDQPDIIGPPVISLYGAYLNEADLGNVPLLNTNLSGAIITEATLYKTNFTDADLSSADLSESDLSEATLVRTNLAGATLTDTKSLTQAQIHQAIGDQQTRLPDDLTRPETWSKSIEEQKQEKQTSQ